MKEEKGVFTMDNQTVIASFRSRQAVLRLENQLNRMGIPAKIVSTPRQVAIGCGLSVSFPKRDAEHVKGWIGAGNTSTFIGFYEVREENGRRFVRPFLR